MGTELPERTFRITRADLVAYAAASGDHNPIHQDEQVALAVGLPGVIAHGMYTLALAARYVDEWSGRPGAIATIRAKFTRPVVVPPDGVDVVVRGAAERRADDERVVVEVTCGGERVLGGCQVTLRD